MSETNPFAALVEDDSSNCAKPPEKKQCTAEETLNSLLERIFAFSLNEEVAAEKGYMFLGNVQGYELLDLNNLSYCLFERLFNCNSENPVLLSIDTKGIDVHSKEYKVINYLFACFGVFREEAKNTLDSLDYSKIKDEVLRSAATAYVHPDIYFEQNLFQQMVNIVLEDKQHADLFFQEVCDAILNHDELDDTILERIVTGFINILNPLVLSSHLPNFDLKIFNILKGLIVNEKFALMFMRCNQISFPIMGVNYVTAMLGSLLNISILPKAPGFSYDHFQDIISPSAVDSTESLLWQKLKLVTAEIHQLLLSLLKKGPLVKEELLNWIGKCLHENSEREKLWNSQAPETFIRANYSNASDGFMIQLASVMLRLCEPICRDAKILKVDPTFCAVPEDQRSAKQIHLPKMSNQTCLLPMDGDDNEGERLTAESYGFTTECFFMTHRSIHLGFTIAVEKLVKMNHELSRTERAFSEARQQVVGYSDYVESLKERLRSTMSKFVSYKAQLSEPNMVSSMFDLIRTTCYWLSQLVMHPNSTDGNSYAPIKEIPVSFPLPAEVPNVLKCIPEFIVGNIVCFVVFIMRFSPKDFEEQGYEKLEPILTFILIFMGDNGLVKNPHLRAQLAEGLEALLPVHKGEFGPKNDPVNFQRTALFSNYEYKKQVVSSLLEVFVGIEMTGQSVEFEQKFNYRRPMYCVIEYLWDREEYQYYFRELAEEAEANMEAVSPPIFLRFINLLMNDAVFLLDESLTNMAKLREMQAARDRGEWDNLSNRERSQNLGHLTHTGLIARFDNILGRDTITALENLTSKITIVFTHSTMVDRMAAMLNYFLLNLVGPNKKNFKVKHQKEYHFDPAETVLKICRIYINLKDNDSFCLAISQDGRSYSPNLFSLAEDVLIRIGGSSFIQEIQELAEKVARKSEEHQASEEAVAEAPDHFLDPIMSTLMMDPVILPSSKQVVDRTTIARHLLSDQTDPFNRSPLSMDQVIPNTELAQEIKAWVEERRSR